MLPPPTTTAVCTPRAVTSFSWRARRLTESAEIPKSLSGGLKASPESFRRTRRNSGLEPRPATGSPAGSRATAPPLGDLLPELEPGEPADLHLLPDLGAGLSDQLTHGLGVVFHEGLIQQAGVLEERLQLALDDPVDHEVGLAVHLDEDAEAAVHVDVRVDDAVPGNPASSLLRVGQALQPKHLNGPVDVSPGLLQGALAVHHARPGELPESLHLVCGYGHVSSSQGFSHTHSCSPVAVPASCGAVAWSAGASSSAEAGSEASPGDTGWGASAPGSAVISSSGGVISSSGTAGASSEATAVPPLPSASGSRGSATAGAAACVFPAARSTMSRPRSLRPSSSASAMIVVTRVTARMASSLPGIT